MSVTKTGGEVVWMKDGYEYRLGHASTSNSRSWVGFNERGDPVGVLHWTKGSLTKRVALKMLSAHYPWAASVRAARRQRGGAR